MEIRHSGDLVVATGDSHIFHLPVFSLVGGTIMFSSTSASNTNTYIRDDSGTTYRPNSRPLFSDMFDSKSEQEIESAYVRLAQELYAARDVSTDSYSNSGTYTIDGKSYNISFNMYRPSVHSSDLAHRLIEMYIYVPYGSSSTTSIQLRFRVNTDITELANDSWQNNQIWFLLYNAPKYNNTQGESWGSDYVTCTLLFDVNNGNKINALNGVATFANYNAVSLSSLYQRQVSFNKLANLIYVQKPAWPGPSSGTGGTGGDFDDSTDSVAIPSLPTVAPAVSSNFITIYHPTMAELEQIGTVLWSSTISAAIKNLFSDPINAIISLHQTPFPLSTADTKTEWFVGLVGTGVSMNKVTQQYLQYDFGSVDITEYWGNALDYSPYTKAQIYLPYIGIKDLDIDDIMASTVRVVYHVDILTGTCVAYIIVTKKDERSPLYDTPTVMYQFTGNTNLMIPYTGADYSALVQNIITLAGAAVAAGATGGLSTQVTGADAIMGASTAMQSVGAVSGSKPTLLRGGQTGGVAGALGVQNCAIYLTRPNQSLAEDYAAERGYPSNITATLGDLTGFTAVESCHVGISGATDEELAEIENFLKSGVIL